MVLQAGGTAGNPDTYTFDPTWGAPGGTTGNKGQTVGVYQFSAGGSVIHGASGFNRLIYANGNSNITFNGMELTGMMWTGSPSYGNAFGFDLGPGSNITVSNIYCHGWTHTGATLDVLACIVGRATAPYNAGSRVTGSVFDGAGASDSGEAVAGIPLVDNNLVRNMTNGILPNMNAVVHDNLIGPINQSFDLTVHENCIEPLGMYAGLISTNYFYNNVWHDCTAVGLLTQGAPSTTGVEIDYIWNNVAYVGSVSSPPIPMQFDSVSTSMSNCEVHAWNNTIYTGTGYGFCMRTINRGLGNFGVLDLRNNHCIAGTGLISLGVTGNTYVDTNNVLDSTTANYNAPPAGNPPPFAYSPISSSANTIGYGQNLSSLATGQLATLVSDTAYGGYSSTNSRGSSSCTPTPGTPGCWDVGAYQFPSTQSSAPPNPPSALQAVVQ
jgi:hypothetical protein